MDPDGGILWPLNNNVQHVRKERQWYPQAGPESRLNQRDKGLTKTDGVALLPSSHAVLATDRRPTLVHCLPHCLPPAHRQAPDRACWLLGCTTPQVQEQSSGVAEWTRAVARLGEEWARWRIAEEVEWRVSLSAHQPRECEWRGCRLNSSRASPASSGGARRSLHPRPAPAQLHERAMTEEEEGIVEKVMQQVDSQR